jgi:hypothetical protein
VPKPEARRHRSAGLRVDAGVGSTVATLVVANTVPSLISQHEAKAAVTDELGVVLLTVSVTLIEVFSAGAR